MKLLDDASSAIPLKRWVLRTRPLRGQSRYYPNFLGHSPKPKSLRDFLVHQFNRIDVLARGNARLLLSVDLLLRQRLQPPLAVSTSDRDESTLPFDHLQASRSADCNLHLRLTQLTPTLQNCNATCTRVLQVLSSTTQNSVDR